MIEYLVFYTELYRSGGWAGRSFTVKRATPIENGDDFVSLAGDLFDFAKEANSDVKGMSVTNIIRLPY